MGKVEISSLKQSLKPLKLFIHGRWEEPASPTTIPVMNPATGEQLASVPDATPEDVDRAVRAARQSFEDRSWRGMDVSQREKIIWRIGELIEAVLQLAPSASQHTKALFRRILRLPDADRWTVCAQANAETRLSAEAREGLRAFLEKRAPAWAVERTEHGEPIAPDNASRRA